MEMTVLGARVATTEKNKMKYYPAYKNAKGAEVSNRLTVPILVNERGQETPFNMIITVWGKLADVCAKSLSPGREVHMILTPKQYASTYKQNGDTVIVNNKPLTITNTNYTVKEIKFGAESASHIASEIKKKYRGEDWFKPGHDDNTALNERRNKINALVYTPGSTTLGYAVIMGATVSQPTAPVNTVESSAPVQNTEPSVPVGQFSQEMLQAAMAHIYNTQYVQTQVAQVAQVAQVNEDEIPF